MDVHEIGPVLLRLIGFTLKQTVLRTDFLAKQSIIVGFWHFVIT
jgi:lysophospholipid acyltransferase (LPLAT)-like uncharacterized protein